MSAAFEICIIWQDVSRLVDLCRQSIVFDTIRDITTCLALIQNDAEVKILRIKNRLDPSYNSARSAGYRDVSINIRIITSESCSIGVNAHVCELQLLLRQYAELKVFTAGIKACVMLQIRC